MNHFFEEIQGWFCFEEPYRQAVREASDGSIFVELGCWKGKSACFLAVEVLNSGKLVDLHFVDHWGGSDEVAHKTDPDLQRVFEMFQDNIGRVPGVNVTVHRSDSSKAAEAFDDGSVNFVWIDAGHGYDEVLADITAWWPKVRPGGVIGGDDLPMVGVEQAVKEYFPNYEVGTHQGWKWWRVRKGTGNGN
jgi:predicted O-methyltransferase YrrM